MNRFDNYDEYSCMPEYTARYSDANLKSAARRNIYSDSPVEGVYRDVYSGYYNDYTNPINMVGGGYYNNYYDSNLDLVGAPRTDMCPPSRADYTDYRDYGTWADSMQLRNRARSYNRPEMYSDDLNPSGSFGTRTGGACTSGYCC